MTIHEVAEPLAATESLGAGAEPLEPVEPVEPLVSLENHYMDCWWASRP